jgi:sugar phosphate isomerase/epimerase
VGQIFQKFTTIAEEVALHQQLGFGATYCRYIADPAQRHDYKQAFAEADIVLAEFGAYGINILDTNPVLRQQNIDEICRRLAYADEMAALLCHARWYGANRWLGRCQSAQYVRKKFL